MKSLLLIAQLFSLIALIGYIWLVVNAFKKSVLWGFGVLLLSPITATFFGIKYWYESKKPFLVYIVPLVIAIALNLTVFTAWDGWKMVGAAKRVVMGISQENLSEEDATEFMTSGINLIENAAPNEKERKKAVLMRRIMTATQSEGSEADRRKLDQAFRDLLDDENLTDKERQEWHLMRKQMKLSALPMKPAPQVEAKRGRKKHHLSSKPSSAQNSSQKSVPISDVKDKRVMERKHRDLERSSVHASLKKEDWSKGIPLMHAKQYLGHLVIVKDKRGIDHEGFLIEASGDTYQIEKRTYAGTLKLSFHTEEIRSLQLKP